VKVHHYKNGFKDNYWIWIVHHEDMLHRDLNEGNSYMDASTNAEYVAQHKQFMLMQDKCVMLLGNLKHLKLQTQIIRKNLQMKTLKDFTFYWWRRMNHCMKGQ